MLGKTTKTSQSGYLDRHFRSQQPNTPEPPLTHPKERQSCGHIIGEETPASCVLPDTSKKLAPVSFERWNKWTKLFTSSDPYKKWANWEGNTVPLGLASLSWDSKWKSRINWIWIVIQTLNRKRALGKAALGEEASAAGEGESVADCWEIPWKCYGFLSIILKSRR